MSTLKIEQNRDYATYPSTIEEVKWNRADGYASRADVTIVVRTRDGLTSLEMDAATTDTLLEALKTALVHREKLAGSVTVEVD